MDIRQQIWGMTPDSEAIILYTMTNARGESVSLTNYGAAITAINVLDKEGKLGDVALGYAKWQDYMSDGPAMGKSVGRYANRIARGCFEINGQQYRLAINNGPNHLHGGPSGFQNRVWGARVEGNRVVFNYLSANGEEGYPGELTVEVCYDWDDESNLVITYFGRSEADTIINLTNHAYFNLSGHSAGSIEDHSLKLYAQKWLPTDQTQIPTGELADVDGTPMDFRELTVIGSRINDNFDALKIGNGYDHCWAIDGYTDGQKFLLAAELTSPVSGRKLTVRTTQPGVQVYTGNWLAGCPESKDGKQYIDRAGVAIECQAFPDSPNKTNFPSVVLVKGKVYEEAIIYSFTTIH